MRVTGSTMMTTMTMMIIFIVFIATNNVEADGRSNRKLKARERMKLDREERESRLLAGGDASGQVFTRGYICIIKPTDYVWAFKMDGFENMVTGTTGIQYLGSSYFQSGGIYDPADVRIVDRVGTSVADDFESYAQFQKPFNSNNYPKFEGHDSEGFFDGKANQLIAGPETESPTNNVRETFYNYFPNRFQFAGSRQPLFVPQADPGYFMNGECVISSAVGSFISGHSCLLNLCLGGGGFNCLAIYAGSKYVFDPLAVTLIQEDKTVDISTVNFTEGGTTSGQLLTQAEYKQNANRIVPALPPSYPGTIIGGTGFFVGAVGYVDVTTITASTLPPWQTFAGQDIDVKTSAKSSEVGYITQKINVVTNRPLPAAP